MLTEVLNTFTFGVKKAFELKWIQLGKVLHDEESKWEDKFGGAWPFIWAVQR